MTLGCPHLDRKQVKNAAKAPWQGYFLMPFPDMSKEENEKEEIPKGTVKSQRNRTKQGVTPEG